MVQSDHATEPGVDPVVVAEVEEDGLVDAEEGVRPALAIRDPKHVIRAPRNIL